jgi:hypothetical protein
VVSVSLEFRLAKIIERLYRADAPPFSQIMHGSLLSEGSKGFETCVLGIKYKVMVADDEVKVLVEDSLYRNEDSSRLIVYVAKALERALDGRLVNYKGRLTKLTQLPGGEAAQLYERRIVNFLAAEVEGSSPAEVEKAAERVGGIMVEHSDATWSFEASPFNGIRLRVAYWQGEEEIPSGAAILLGEEAKEASIPIEELIVIMEMAVNRFVLFYRKEAGKKPRLFESLYL